VTVDTQQAPLAPQGCPANWVTRPSYFLTNLCVSRDWLNNGYDSSGARATAVTSRVLFSIARHVDGV